MMLAVRLLEFLALLMLLSWALRLLHWVLRRMVREIGAPHASQTQRSPQSPAPQAAETPVNARRLVRDPVCGIHVAEVLAVPLRAGKETMYFCSQACRERYLAETRKAAANE
jgi:YHS domain-containing protein